MNESKATNLQEIAIDCQNKESYAHCLGIMNTPEKALDREMAAIEYAKARQAAYASRSKLEAAIRSENG